MKPEDLMCTVNSDDVLIERKVVVFFDICSSTKILEELKQTDNLEYWRSFLIFLKNCIDDDGKRLGMKPYKFLGDGWILLFPPTVRLPDLYDFLFSMCTGFDSHFDCTVLPLLQKRPDPLGLTFGVDSGELVKTQMHGREEYLGRAINLAARLQGATKVVSKNNNYGNTVLFSKHSFNSLDTSGPEGEVPMHVNPVKVPLKNIISGEEYECFWSRVL